MGINDIKEMIIKELLELEYKKIDKLEYFDKFTDVYQMKLDNIEINFCLTKDGDKNVFEIISFKDNENGTKLVCRAYEYYTNILMDLKSEDFTIKSMILGTVEKIIQSLEVE